MSIFSNIAGKVGGFLSNPIGSITGALGMQNQYDPQSANIANPFGSDAAAQAAIGNAMGASGGVWGQQGALAQQLIQRMNQSDPRYDALIQQTMAQAAGQGPNPAQAQFQQNMNQAVQQQAGAIASVRGLNPALAARLAATGGAGMMQNAAGQAATLQAQQQLAAQGLAGQLIGQQTQLQQGYGGLGASLLGTMGGQGMTQQQILQAAIANQNAQRVAMQSNINQVGAGVAAQNAQLNAGLVGGILQGLGGAAAQGSLPAGAGAAAAAAKGGRVTRTGVSRQPQKMANGGVAAGPLQPAELPSFGPADASTPSIPIPDYLPPIQPFSPQQMLAASAPAPTQPAKSNSPLSSLGQSLAATGASGQQAFREFAGGASAGAPWVLAPGNFAKGGNVPAPGAAAPVAAPNPMAQPPSDRLPEAPAEVANRAMAVAHTVAKSLSQMDPRAAAVVFADLTGLPTNYTPDDIRRSYHALALHNAALLAQRPTAPTASPPVAQWMPRRPAEDTVPLKRAMGGRAAPIDARSGGKVPGAAQVAGDSERNDTVPAMLSPKEIVLPRSVTMAPDAPQKAAKFVSHLVSRRKFGFGGVVDAKKR